MATFPATYFESKDKLLRSRAWTALTGPVARVAFGLPFIVFGAFHFVRTAELAQYLPGFVPAPAFWVYFTGLALIAAGVAFITNYYVRAAGVGLALMLLTFILVLHVPALANDATRTMATSALLKDLGLAAGALLLAGRATPRPALERNRTQSSTKVEHSL